MTAPLVRVERRAGQRFPYLLPVSFRDLADGREGMGFTQDVSSRGVFFFTDVPLSAESAIELTLNMPSEITLGESMRVRCRAKVLRVVGHEVSSAHNFSDPTRAETKIGVAVRLECYEYLPESTEPAASFARVSALHTHRDAEEETIRLSAPTVEG
jgi:PilZ domain